MKTFHALTNPVDTRTTSAFTTYLTRTAKALIVGLTLIALALLGTPGRCSDEKAEPKNAKEFVDRGLAFWRQNDYDRAIPEFTTAIRLDPKMVVAYYYRGDSFRCNKEYDKAIADYTEAIRLDPKNANAYDGRALSFACIGEHDKSAADKDEFDKLVRNQKGANDSPLVIDWTRGSRAPFSRPLPLTDGKATVVVKVPDGAKVYLVPAEDRVQEMAVNKTECRFTSRESLDPEKPGYFYTVRVKYSAEGRDFTETRKVRVFADKTTELDLSDIEAPSKKLRTYQYWCEVGVIGNEWMPKAKDVKPIEYAHALKQIASEMDGLPVRGVDEDAVSAMQDMSEVLGKMAKFIEENNGLGRGGEAFIRGMLGDPFGVAQEVAADQKALKDALEKATTKIKKTRSVLTARYDIEFPQQ
jgi:tetratricopeptide (TPR) repeat protein